MVLLIIAMFLTGNRRFIFEPLHGSLIGIFTITLPAFFISFWSQNQSVERKNIRIQLTQFVFPAALTITIAVIGTYLFFDGQGYSFFRIKHIITHFLVLIGLMLVVFCYPPTLWRTGNGTRSSNWRWTIASMLLLIIFIALTYFRPFQYFFRLFPLISIADYFLVGGIGLAWGMLTVFLLHLTRSTFSADRR